MPAEALQHTQAWLQAAILDPPAAAGVAEVVAASAELTADQRLAIYQQGYRARLVECLRAHYPVLCQVVGDDVLDEFALDYLHWRPSRSHTLHTLGDGFAAYLQHTRPDQDTAFREDWIEVLLDLARFERAFTETYSAAGPEKDEPPQTETLPRVGSPAWRDTVAVPTPCLRLLRAGFPIHRFAAALRRGETATPPPPEPTHLVLSRHDFVVTVTELDATHHELLAALACRHTLAAAARQTGLTEAAVDTGLRQWTQQHLFTTHIVPHDLQP